MSKNEPLFISRVQESGFMGIVAFNVGVERQKLVVLRGPNGSGKTSAMQGIVCALNGKKYHPEKPVNADHRAASVSIDLVDENMRRRYRVVSRWTSRGGYELEVTGADNTKIDGPQTFLNSLKSISTFNPTDFFSADAKTRVATLMKAIGKEEEFLRKKAERAKLFADRTIANREVDNLTTRLRANPDPSPEVTLEPRSIDEYAKVLRDHSSAMAAREAKQREVSDLGQRIDDNAARIQRMLQENNELKMRRNALIDEVQKCYSEEATLKSRRDALEPDSKQTEQHNANVSRQREARDLAKRLEREREVAAALTSAIDHIDAQVSSILAASPLKDIGQLDFDDQTGSISIDGIPIDQCNTAKKIRAACRISMATKPSVRVICIDEGDKLDKESIDEICSIAEEYGYQFWMTGNYIGDPQDPRQLVIEMANGIGGNTDPQPEPEPISRKHSDAEIAAMMDGYEPERVTPAAAATPQTPPPAVSEAVGRKFEFKDEDL